MWKEVFPKAEIFGVDIKYPKETKFLKGLKDVEILVGDQSDELFLKNKVLPLGPFDIIIDDGCHCPKPIMISLNTLWGSLAEQGFYIIEDLWTCIRRSGDKPLVMNRLHEMAEKVYSTPDILSVNFYPNICFVEKA